MCYVESSIQAEANRHSSKILFHQRNQGLNELVAEYIIELRKLALHCEFGEFLNDVLQDRIVAMRPLKCCSPEETVSTN